MLQSIRDKITGWFAIVFLGAIAIVFIFWGVDMGRDSTTRYAAKVNGEGIAVETVRRAWQEREQQLQQMMHGAVPESMVKMQQRAVLDEQIRTQLLTQRARALGYRVSNAMMQQTITGFPSLQIDGQFSHERYELLLRQQGRSIAEFERDLRASMEIDQLQRGIAASAFVTPAELLRREALEGEQREIDYAVIPASSFLASVIVDENQIQSWYEAHKTEYMTPETVDLEYLELKLADVARDVPVNDEVLQAYYEQVKERLTTPERRRARHILISTEGVDDATAKKTAEEVLTKLKAGGDFAALTKQYSKDALSAAKGGDLDWASRGMFVGPFEEALFSMSKGELRGPIKTQFGYHIIRLDDIEGGQTKSFAEARAELENDYRRDQAQSLYYERSQKLADEAFKALTELGTVGTALNLPVQKVPGFTRQGGGVFGSDPKIIDAAFRSESIDKGENSSLIALGDDRAMVLRVAAHQPPTQLPIAAVHVQIEAKLKEQAAKDAATKRGTELLARLNGGALWSAVLTDAKLTAVGKHTVGRTESSVPTPVRKTAFDIPRVAVAPSKIVYRGAITDDGGYAIIAVSDVHPGVLTSGTPENVAKVRQRAQSQGSEEFAAYLNEVERSAKIERNPKVFD